MKDTYIRVRISTRDKNELQRQADAVSMSMSEYIVYLIRKNELPPKEYTVFWVGGEKDGQTLYETNDLDDAIRFANQFTIDHEEEFDPCCGGVGIVDGKGKTIEW